MSVWVIICMDLTIFIKRHQWLVLGQHNVSVSAHRSGFYLFHKDTSDWCRVNSISVWVLIGVDFTSFTSTPVTGAGSTVCQCECSLEWILPLSQGHQWLVSGQQYVSVSAHRSGFYLFHKDTSDWCRVNSMSVWVLIGVDFTSFTRTPVTGVGSTVCQCEWSSEWILPLSLGHQQLLFDHSWQPGEEGPSFQSLLWWRPSACCGQSTPPPLCTN